MATVAGPFGPIEEIVTGADTPTTVFAHGFASSIGETRPFGSGVAGTRVFFHFRGHGASPSPDSEWSYRALAAELAAVADAHDASRAVGVSLGAGAILSLVARDPRRFERLVLILPPAIDEARSGRALDRVDEMADLAEAGDLDALAQIVLDEQAPEVREGRAVRMWARMQAERMAGDGLRPVMRAIPRMSPLSDRGDLASVDCPVLVIGQSGDEAHPSSLVDELADVLPNAVAKVLPPGGVLWSHRAETRALVSAFLNVS